MSAVAITTPGMLVAYLMALLPVLALLWWRVPLVSTTLIALLRMSVQLLFVALYLQVIFRLDRPWLTGLWLVAMIVAAEWNIVRGCGFSWRRAALPIAAGLVLGTALPLLVLMLGVLGHSAVLEPRYAIPLAGMILGNCLRADIVGLKSAFGSLRRERKAYELHLAWGARASEAFAPYAAAALRAALEPTIATIATIGLVSLPGMMTGVILGGTDPATAVCYQIAIMAAIFAGTTLTVMVAVSLLRRSAFDVAGNLDETLFSQPEG